MLSLAELKALKDLHELTVKTVDIYEARRQRIEEYRKVSKLLENARASLARLRNELHNEVVPRVKEDFLRGLLGANKVTISAVEDVVKRHPEVTPLVKEIALTEIAVEEFRGRREDIYLDIEMCDKAATALESIGRNEGLRQKVKFGMTRVDVEGYLGEETAR